MEGYFEDARQDYFTVPNYVEDMPEDVLCVHAFRILCHVRRTMPGTFFDVRKLCERFGIGYDGKVWRRVSVQLRKLGCLTDVEVKDAHGRVVARRLRFSWPDPVRAKGTDGVLGYRDTAPIRAKGTDPSVQKERMIDIKLKTPAVGAAPQARRRRPPGKAAAISPAPEPVEPGELVELGEPGELGDHGPIDDRSEAVASEVPLGSEAPAPWRVASSPSSAISPRPDPVPEVLEYLASRDRPYFLQR